MSKGQVVKDLRKAAWYLNREISRREAILREQVINRAEEKSVAERDQFGMKQFP